jgi:hypothetical protein
MSFAYTTGNPDNLVGGEDASMVDIQGPFYDLRAYLNQSALQRVVDAPDLLERLAALEQRVAELETAQ